MKRFRWLWGGIALTVLLAGCGGDPAPEISPPNKVVDSPPEDPAPVELTPEEKAQQEAQALKKQNISDAMAFLDEFYQEFTAVSTSDFNGERLYAFAPRSAGTEEFYHSIELAAGVSDTYTGRWFLVKQEVLDYDPGAPGEGKERILIEGCLDQSSVVIHRPDGSSLPFGQGLTRVIQQFTVEHMGPGLPWYISKEEYLGASCE